MEIVMYIFFAVLYLLIGFGNMELHKAAKHPMWGNPMTVLLWPMILVAVAFLPKMFEESLDD